MSTTMIIVIIVIILLIVIPVILAGFLYVWVSGFESEGGSTSIRMSAIDTEKTTAYVIDITSVGGGSLNLDDARFEVSDPNGILEYRTITANAWPAAFTKGDSTIYAIPAGIKRVKDTEGYTVDANTDLDDYENCYMAYIDANSDGKITSGDSIWIYKDYDADDYDEIISRCTFRILNENNEIVWVNVFKSEGGGFEGNSDYIRITAVHTEKYAAYAISISSVSDGTLNLEDAKFEMADPDGILEYRAQTTNANPAVFQKGQSDIYAIPSGASAVNNGTTTITQAHDLEDYEDCYMAYIDLNRDGKVSADDCIWIFKDYDNDSFNEIESRYTFKILDQNNEMVLKKQL